MRPPRRAVWHGLIKSSSRRKRAASDSDSASDRKSIAFSYCSGQMVEAGYLFLNALWTGPLREELFVQHRCSDGQEHSDALCGPCFRPELLTYFYRVYLHAPVHRKSSSPSLCCLALKYFISRWTALGWPGKKEEGGGGNFQNAPSHQETNFCGGRMKAN